MHWTALIGSLIMLVFSVVGQVHHGVSIDQAEIERYYGTPPESNGSGDPPADQPHKTGGEPQEEEEEACVCVPFYTCRNGTINTFGAGLLDVRSLQPKCSLLERCCTIENRLDTNSTIEPTLSNVNNGHTCCGKRNKQGIGFEITGATDEDAKFAEFPWMTALLFKEFDIFVYKCGGSLIHPQVVLTAAHCVQEVDVHFLVARAGEWDMQSTSELYPHQERDVKRVIVHEGVDKENMHNDIALVVLRSGFDPALHIDVVCLPTQGQNFDNSRCLVSGWGKENFGKTSEIVNILKSIELSIMPHAQCQEAFRSTRLGHYFKLHTSFTCAGGEKGKDTCKGDGGGPLVCPVSKDQERYILAGITSWGIGCGNPRIPGAYVSVAMFRNWIDKEMKNEGFVKDYSPDSPPVY